MNLFKQVRQNNNFFSQKQKWICYKLRIPNLIMSTNFEREVLNHALATTSSLSDASIILNDFALYRK